MANVTKHMKPGYEWDEAYGAGQVQMVRLLPVRKDHVYDNVNGVYLGEIRGRFTARAVLQDDGWYLVTTQAGGQGGRRYRDARDLDDAKQQLEAWYWRRFRYVDEPRPQRCLCGKVRGEEYDYRLTICPHCNHLYG